MHDIARSGRGQPLSLEVIPESVIGLTAEAVFEENRMRGASSCGAPASRRTAGQSSDRISISASPKGRQRKVPRRPAERRKGRLRPASGVRFDPQPHRAIRPGENLPQNQPLTEYSYSHLTRHDSRGGVSAMGKLVLTIERHSSVKGSAQAERHAGARERSQMNHRMSPTTTGILAVVFGAFLIFVTAAAMWRMRRQHASSVFVLTYFLSLSCCLTLGIGVWATTTGAIRADGAANNTAGVWILWALGKVADLGDEFELFIALAAAAVIPQLVAYVLASFAGCAGRPWGINDTVGLLAWSFAKSFVVAGGTISVAVIYGYFHGWAGLTGPAVTGTLMVTLLLVMYGTLVILVHQETRHIARWVSQWIPPAVQRLHRRATIHRRREQARDLRRRRQELRTLAVEAGLGVHRPG